MFSIGWTELMVVGIVALIVVGPKDLPGLFRNLGRMTGKMRRMARDFQRAMEDAADEAGVKDVAKDLNKVANPRKMGLDALNDAADRFDKWEPGKSTPSDTPRGPATTALTEERREAARKIHEQTAKRAEERRAAEAEAAAAQQAAADAADGDPEPQPEADKT